MIKFHAKKQWLPEKQLSSVFAGVRLSKFHPEIKTTGTSKMISEIPAVDIFVGADLRMIPRIGPA